MVAGAAGVGLEAACGTLRVATRGGAGVGSGSLLLWIVGLSFGTGALRTGGGGTLDFRSGGGAEETVEAPGPEGGHSDDGRSAASEAVPSVTALLTWMTYPHLRHFIRTERPATFSSAI